MLCKIQSQQQNSAWGAKYPLLQKYYSLWSKILTTLFSVNSGFGSAIHTEYMDFVPELGWQF